MIYDEMWKNRSKSVERMRKKTRERRCADRTGQRSVWLFTPGIRLCLACLAVALLAMACADDVQSSEGGDDKTDAVIRLTINASTPQSTSTRSVDEDKIHDLHVLVYNSSGELTGKSYSTFDASPYSITVNARSGDGCTIYAIANTNSSTLFDGTVANTKDKLKAITTSSTTWAALNNSSSTITYPPMCDSILANISAGATTLDGGMTVKRLVAKVTLDVDIASGSGVTISGYRIYGVPKKSYYVAHPLTTEESSTDTQPTRAVDASQPANASDWTDSELISLSDVSSLNTTFYMYENRPGITSTITAQKNKVKANAPGTPADSAAYVMIYGKAPGYSSLSWKIYLGANNTSNFNIKRNNQYTCTITLKANDSDTRIAYKKSGTVWAGSNIYWDGTKLTFDASSVDPANPSAQELANQKKQGIAFKWGSLVGISLNSTYVTYTPVYNSIIPTSSTWSTGSSTYTNIAYFTNNLAGGQTNTFLNDAAQNTADNYADRKGDICQYLSKTGAVSGSWRMPTSKEFNAAGLADNVSVSWTTATTPWASFGNFVDQTGSVNAQGTFLLSSGGTYTVNGNSNSFPASGNIYPDSSLHYVGQDGHYWSSSAYTDSTIGCSCSLGFFTSSVYPASYNHRTFGFMVRCVQN